MVVPEPGPVRPPAPSPRPELLSTFPDGPSPARDEDRLAAIGRLAAGVAHDFNNIVAVVSLCAELLEAQPGLDEDGREQVALIRREAERGASMIWQILDFAHRGPIERVPVDLDEFFAGLLPVLRRIEPGRISVHLHADDAEHRVSVDAGQLEQIVYNLATNATDAMPASGRIDITLTRETVSADAPGPVPAMAPGPWVRIGLGDSGGGIPPDVLPRIFEPFFSTKPAGRGTGLGLAQVAGLVSQLDGHVHVTSRLGKGTTVEVWIPALDTIGPWSSPGRNGSGLRP